MQNPQKTLDVLRKEYFEAISNPVEHMYVDIEMLQDLRLGALLTTVTVQEEVAYIMSQIPQYNKRLDLKTAKYFPILRKTDEELDAIIKDNPNRIALLSPWTNIYHNFLSVVEYIMMNNKAALDKPVLLEIVVNCSLIEYPVELFDRLVKGITLKYPRIRFKLSHKPMYTGPVDFYSSFDMFFLYDHEKFLNNEKLLDVFTNKDRFMSKIVYTLPVVNESLGLDPSEYAKALASTRAMLDMFCDFFYMTGGIPQPPPTKAN